VIFVETAPFERLRETYLDDGEYRLLQIMLMINPAAGDLIIGSGGIRKVRWSTRGSGKRGGLRVIYYWLAKRDQILLLTVYRKSEVEDLTLREVSILRSLVKRIEDQNDETKAVR
jgi:mRNA-degrading endonuclease RelE of RelBE toxin-antitoxin system